MFLVPLPVSLFTLPLERSFNYPLPISLSLSLSMFLLLCLFRSVPFFFSLFPFHCLSPSCSYLYRNLTHFLSSYPLSPSLYLSPSLSLSLSIFLPLCRYRSRLISLLFPLSLSLTHALPRLPLSVSISLSLSLALSFPVSLENATVYRSWQRFVHCGRL